MLRLNRLSTTLSNNFPKGPTVRSAAIMSNNIHNKRKEPPMTSDQKKPAAAAAALHKKMDTPTTTSTNNNNQQHASPPPPIQIDGSYKEGGGQILRNTITYAVLLQKSVTISKIRANRPNKPGVRPQHLAGMTLALEIGNADCNSSDVGGSRSVGELVGAEVGAETVSYRCQSDDHVGTVASSNNDQEGTKHFIADTKTAGSIALLLQAAFLPALVQAMRHHRYTQTIPPKTDADEPMIQIELRGGTNATGAPQIDYITHVFAPFVNAYFQQRGSDASSATTKGQQPVDIQIIKRGYFPKGGGIVRVNLRPPSTLLASFSSTTTSEPITFSPIRLINCPPVASLSIKAFHAGNCPAWIAQKMVNSAVNELKRTWRNDVPGFRKRFMSVGEDNKEHNAKVSPIIADAEIAVTHETNCIGSGSGILIIAYPDNKDDGRNLNTLPCLPLASSGLGSRKIPPAQTGITAAQELIECITSGGCVDRWMQDQIIPFMALASSNSNNGSIEAKSEVLTGELTLHTQTAMKVAEEMTGCKFEVERLDFGVGAGGGSEQQQEEGTCYGETGRILGRHVIRCSGIGFAYA